MKHGKPLLSKGDLEVSEVRFIPRMVHLYVTSKTEGYLILTRKEVRALLPVLEAWVRKGRDDGNKI